MKDEILLEVWRNRDEFASRHNYNLDAMVAELQEMECHSWRTLVDRRESGGDRSLQSKASRRG
ncbi:MAG: hypothetical protein V1800_14265 [Candidatus Latescibacterota bacterium]